MFDYVSDLADATSARISSSLVIFGRNLIAKLEAFLAEESQADEDHFLYSWSLFFSLYNIFDL